MKVTIEIDCTAEEARTFFGLPDVQPMQARLMKDVEAQLKANVQDMDPEKALQSWFSFGGQGLEHLQKAFWQSAGRAAAASEAAASSGTGERKKSDPKR